MITENWTEEDAVIACRRSHGNHYEGIVYINCENCKEEISASPITVEKSKQPGWHVICRDCFKKVNSEVTAWFAGTIKKGATELPHGGEN